MMQDPDTQPVSDQPPTYDGWVVWTFDDNSILYLDTQRMFLIVPVLLIAVVALLMWHRRREEKKPKPKGKK